MTSPDSKLTENYFMRLEIKAVSLPFMLAEFAVMFLMIFFPILVTGPARWFHG